MKQHVAKVATTCFYHLRQMRQRVSAKVTTQFVLASHHVLARLL